MGGSTSLKAAAEETQVLHGVVGKWDCAVQVNVYAPPLSSTLDGSQSLREPSLPSFFHHFGPLCTCAFSIPPVYEIPQGQWD